MNKEAIETTIEHGWQSLISATVAILASLLLAWMLSRLVRALFRVFPRLECYAVILPMRTLIFGLASCSSNLPLLQIAYVFAYGLGGYWGLISITLILTILGVWFFTRMFLGMHFQANKIMQGLNIARSVVIASVWVGFSAGTMTGSGSRLARDSFNSFLQMQPSHTITAAISGFILSIIFDMVLGTAILFLSKKNFKQQDGEPSVGENASRSSA